MCHEIHGRLFEATTLGTCTIAGSSYIPFREALAEVRKHQPRNTCLAARRLHSEVARRFERCGMTVKFFTAVHSTLDFFHGVDAFLEAPCGIVVTLDVTTNPAKIDGKADLILHPEDFEDLSVVADKIVRIFAAKAAKQRQRKFH